MPNGGIGAITSAQSAAAGQAASAAAKAALAKRVAPTPTPTGAGGAYSALPSWAGGLGSAGIGGIGEAGGFRTTTPSWLDTGKAAFLGGLPFGSQLGQVLAPTPTPTTAWTPSPGESLPAQLPYTPTTNGDGTTPTGDLSPTGYPFLQWVFDEKKGKWGYWYVDANMIPRFTGDEEPEEGMTEYERAYLEYQESQAGATQQYQQQQLAFQQQQAATQEAARLREWLAALAADPSRWIELSQYNTQQPGTVPEWLSGIYEGQVPAGAPLGEAREVGPVPQLSKQWWDWLSPAEREKLMGYMTWINMEPEDWMSRQWWMRGQQPYGMGQQFAPFRQYG